MDATTMAATTVHHLVIPWADSFDDKRPEHVGKVVRQSDGSLSANLWMRGQKMDGTPLPNRLAFSFLCRVGSMDWPAGGSIRSWGLERIGPGTWVVSPSYFVPGQLHAYIVFRDVPEPAPFT